MGFSDDRIEALRQRTGRESRSWLVDPAWLDERLLAQALAEVREALGGGLRWRLYPDGCGGFLLVLELGRGLLSRHERSAQYAAVVRAGEGAARYFVVARLQQFDEVADSEAFAVLSLSARWPPTWICWETACAIVEQLAELLEAHFR